MILIHLEIRLNEYISDDDDDDGDDWCKNRRDWLSARGSIHTCGYQSTTTTAAATIFVSNFHIACVKYTNTKNANKQIQKNENTNKQHINNMLFSKSSEF